MFEKNYDERFQMGYSARPYSQAPQLACYWEVYFEEFKISATEVTGLNEKLSHVSIRSGEDKGNYTQIEIPDPARQTVSIKWGIFKGGQNGAHLIQLWRDVRSYYNVLNSINILVVLVDEDDDEIMYWVLRNCVPVELKGPTLDAGKSAIAMHTLDLSVESVRSKYANHDISEFRSYLKKRNQNG